MTQGKPSRPPQSRYYVRSWGFSDSGVFWPGGHAMSDPKLLSLARDLRTRAEEISARAETFHDAHARQKIRKIAAIYVRLAERLEQR